MNKLRHEARRGISGRLQGPAPGSVLARVDLPVPFAVQDMPPIPNTRVARSLMPGKPGTVKLGRLWGPSLLLVRYRHDWTGLYRYTTVELLVDATPVSRGKALQATYSIRLKNNERELKAAARRLGARWDPQVGCWSMSGLAVQTLGLAHRVEWAQLPRPPRKSKRNTPQPTSDDE